MEELKKIPIIVAFFVIFLVSLSGQAQNKTPNYWKCKNRIGGSYKFGQVPKGCDVSEFQPASYVLKNYNSIIFNDRKSESAERKRYMQKMYSTLKNAIKDYLKNRKPGVSSSELSIWTRAVLALSHQETFFTHYRKASDNRVKMVRGDFGHGHGIMQVDDRWHFAYVKSGKAADIIQNMRYAMEIYYQAWQRAAKKSCVGSSLKNRARAAYSGFNGGLGSLCRWTNPKHKWARNDKGFLTKYNNREWLKYVGNTNEPSPIDTDCRINNGDCDNVDPKPSSKVSEGIAYKVNNKNICILKGKEFSCTESAKDLACLTKALKSKSTSAKKLSLSSSELKKYNFKNLDRHYLCKKSYNVVGVGEFIQLKVNINFRKTPAGTKIAVVRKRTKAQVLDFQVNTNGKVYYQINYNNRLGYIFSNGPKYNYTQKTKPYTSTKRYIASNGETLRIKNKPGINIRDKVKGKVVGFANKGEEALVLSYTVLSGINKVYYQVEMENGKQGYIYGGSTLSGTISSWVEVLGNKPRKTMQLKSNLWSKVLKSCPSEECSNESQFISGPQMSKAQQQEIETVQVLQTQGEWAQVMSDSTGTTGWIALKDLDEIH